MSARAIVALPHGPGRWDDGVDGSLLCHLLSGGGDDPVHGAAMLRFRCRAAPCHRLSMPHYCGLQDVAVWNKWLETVGFEGGAVFDLDVCECDL